MNCSLVNTPIAELKPTQSGIDLDKIWEHIACDGDNNKIYQMVMDCNTEGTVLGSDPLVTFGDGFIADGHHRWAQR